jgi:hypothetical protein
LKEPTFANAFVAAVVTVVAAVTDRHSRDALRTVGRCFAGKL